MQDKNSIGGEIPHNSLTSLSLVQLSFFRSEDKFLSVRMLLEINEDLLTKHKFKDVWRKEKEIENAKALELFTQRVSELDQIQNEVDRWHEIFRGELCVFSFIFVPHTDRFCIDLLYNHRIPHRHSSGKCIRLWCDTGAGVAGQ